jgi:hypothetical protein
MLWGCEVDETDSEKCPKAGFDISGVGPLGSAARDLVTLVIFTHRKQSKGKYIPVLN